MVNLVLQLMLCFVIVMAVPKLLGTVIEALRKLVDVLNNAIRKAFKLDEDKKPKMIKREDEGDDGDRMNFY